MIGDFIADPGWVTPANQKGRKSGYLATCPSVPASSLFNLSEWRDWIAKWSEKNASLFLGVGLCDAQPAIPVSIRTAPRTILSCSLRACHQQRSRPVSQPSLRATIVSDLPLVTPPAVQQH